MSVLMVLKSSAYLCRLQGVERYRFKSLVNYFVFITCFCIDVAMCGLVHDVDTIFHLL